MIEFDEYKVKLNNIRPRLDALADSLGIEAAKEEIDRLHAQIDSEGFWDNQEISQKVMKQSRTLEAKVARYEKMCSQWDDLYTLCEMALEDNDDSMLPELTEGYAQLEQEMENARLETLLSGGYIVQQVDENLTYDYLHSSEENLWSILYLTGYLTSVRADELENPLPERFTALTIPNEEIREIYETTVIRWFDESAPKWNRSALFDAVWKGNIQELQGELNRLLRRTISYHDYKEDFYHAFLTGILAGSGCAVESNREHGEGRSDIVMYHPDRPQVVLFEAKYAKTLNGLEASCAAALQQIEDRQYAKEFEEDYDSVLCYGIAFYKKRCLVRTR